MHETGEKDDSQRHSIVLKDQPYVVLEQRARANHSTEIPKSKYQQGHHDGEVESFSGALVGQDLDAFLQINKRNVETENVAGEPRNVFQPVASIGNREDPMHHHRPESNPAHEGKVVGAGRSDDIVDCIIEHRDWTFQMLEVRIVSSSR